MLRQDDYKHHISEQFNIELDELKNRMLEMGGRVEQQLGAALDALVSMDSGAAESVIEADHEVNELERRIDEHCAAILALRQPTASDLRLVMTAVKVNTDLERIGDEAAKIARQAVRLAEEGNSPSNFIELRHIGNHVTMMLRQSLDALARYDVTAAVGVMKDDNTVDREYGSALRSLMTFMMEDPRHIGAIINEMWALRSLERIGDHASNIAEQVVYLVHGFDVRHGHLDDVPDRLLEEPE